MSRADDTTRTIATLNADNTVEYRDLDKKDIATDFIAITGRVVGTVTWSRKQCDVLETVQENTYLLRQVDYFKLYAELRPWVQWYDD